MEREEIIIIGAGAAGLMAARELQKKGIRFAILEATDRTGGRAFTKSGDPYVEFGPEFLHGETPVTDELMEEFNLPWYELKFDYHLYLQGKLRPLPDFWERLFQMVSEIDVKGNDLPFMDYLTKYDHHSLIDQKIAKSFVQGFDAADLNTISTKSLKEQTSDPAMRKMRRPLDGYGKLMENLSEVSHSKIYFSHFVESIDWKDGKVTVKGYSGEGRVPFQMESKKIIITSSLAALKNMKLNPMPLELKRFLNQNEMGQVVKVVAELEKDFFHLFPEKKFPFIASPDLCFSAWWTTTPIQTRLITGWAGGEKARKLEEKSLEERRQIFIQELATISNQCPTRVGSWIRNVHHHDWGKDPSFLGAYSYPRVVEGERAKAETVFNETLYLAGEAFHEEMSGTIEGALSTGRDAAGKIIEVFSESENVDVSRPLRQGRI